MHEKSGKVVAHPGIIGKLYGERTFPGRNLALVVDEILLRGDAVDGIKYGIAADRFDPSTKDVALIDTLRWKRKLGFCLPCPYHGQQVHIWQHKESGKEELQLQTKPERPRRGEELKLGT